MLATQATSPSKTGVRVGWLLSGLAIAFLIFDGATKLIAVKQVVDATAQLGFSESRIPAIGAVLLVCTALYALPRTAVLGALLLTGYLGGATAVMVQSGHSPFEMLFPVAFAALAWAGVWLRDERLRTLIPFRR